MKNLSLEAFTNVLSAKKPVPGGGGAASLAGALAASLASMVVNYTLGKKRYAKYEDKLETIMKKSVMLKDDMLGLIQEDANAFEPLSKAYGLPTDNDGQRKEKEIIMEKALVDAAIVPLEIARKSCEIIELHTELLEIGSKIVLSDVGVGVALAKSTLQSAILNVYINTSLMKYKETTEKLNSEAEYLDRKYSNMAEETYNKVVKHINR